MVPRKGDGRECCGVWQTSGSGEKAAWWQRRRAAGAAAAGAWRRRRQRRWCRVAYRDVVRVVGHVGGDQEAGHCATRGQDHDGSGGGNGEGGAAGSGGGGGAGRRRGRAVGGGGGEVRSPVGGAKDAEGNVVQNGMTAGEDRRSVGGRGWCIGGRRRGRKVAEDRGVEGRREVEAAFLKRALEITKSTGGREGLEGKSSAGGGLGHGAEGLNSEG